MSGFYFRFLDALAADERLSAHAKAVGARLARYADFDTGRNAYPGVPQLAQDTTLSESSVKRALKDLRQGGYAWLAERGRYRTKAPASVYHLRLPATTGHPDPSFGNEGSQRTERQVTQTGTTGPSDPPPTHRPTQDQEELGVQRRVTSRANAAKVPCPRCDASPGANCTDGRSPRSAYHHQRHTAAIAAGAEPLDLTKATSPGPTDRDAYADHWAQGGSFSADDETTTTGSRSSTP